MPGGVSAMGTSFSLLHLSPTTPLMPRRLARADLEDSLPDHRDRTGSPTYKQRAHKRSAPSCDNNMRIVANSYKVNGQSEAIPLEI
jgi:hypothetical protein